MKKCFLPHSSAGLSAAVLLIAGAPATAQQPSVPQSGGLNLGNTSFYDAMSLPTGLTWASWLRHSSADHIKDGKGQDVQAFQNPKIESTAWVNQLIYASPVWVANWQLGFSAIVPTVWLDSSFGAGATLKAGGAGIGDITLGAALQSAPVVTPAGHPVFSQRVALDVTLPTGRYDRHADLNPGAGFASIIPYWAGTWFPAPRWEMSWRLHYLYNLRNNDPASSSPAPFNGQTVTSTQAGDAGWINFTASYSVTPDVSLGINGYYLQQLSDSRANGTRLADSRERVLGIGPGLMWRLAPNQALWINTYNESKVRSRSAAPFVAQVRAAISF
jgi:hypothetical protein